MKHTASLLDALVADLRRAGCDLENWRSDHQDAPSACCAAGGFRGFRGHGELAAVSRRKFRRPRRRGDAAGDVERDGECRLESGRPRLGLVVAHRVGRQDFRDFGGGREGTADAARGRLSGRSCRRGGCASVDALLPRFRDGKNPLGVRGAQGHPAADASPAQFLCLRDAGHRWRARLCLLCQHRPVLLRHGRQEALGAALAELPDARRLEHRHLARAARRPHLHPERQRPGVLPRNARQTTRARRSGVSRARRRARGPRLTCGKAARAPSW